MKQTPDKNRAQNHPKLDQQRGIGTGPWMRRRRTFSTPHKREAGACAGNRTKRKLYSSMRSPRIKRFSTRHRHRPLRIRRQLIRLRYTKPDTAASEKTRLCPKRGFKSGKKGYCRLPKFRASLSQIPNILQRKSPSNQSTALRVV